MSGSGLTSNRRDFGGLRQRGKALVGRFTRRAVAAERASVSEHLRGKIAAIAAHRIHRRLSDEEARLLTDCLDAAAIEIESGLHAPDPVQALRRAGL